MSRLTSYEGDKIADENFRWREKYDWRRSRKGNIYRHLPGGLIVTVFSTGKAYSYCIARGNEPTYSNRLFLTEEEAMNAVMKALEERP